METQQIPKSFVIKSGNCSKNTNKLVRDFRLIMEPNTATNLKERKQNKIKDFLMVSAQLKVSHLLIFTSKTNLNLRIAKLPKGPTISFKVNEYSLAKDVLKLQQRPKSFDTQSPPLIVLNNFDTQKHSILVTTMLQNMFPTINVNKVKLNECKRVVLFNYNPESDSIELRHYRIGIKTLGISKSIKTIINTNIPDLSKFEDVSDYIIRGAFASESDVEDLQQESIVKQDQAIKLFELGPRLDLKLIKIQDGLCAGPIIHHSFVSKTKQEIKNLESKKQDERQLKEKRRKEQEQNVRKKLKKMDQDEDDQIDFENDEFDDLMEISDDESEPRLD